AVEESPEQRGQDLEGVRTRTDLLHVRAHEARQEPPLAVDVGAAEALAHPHLSVEPQAVRMELVADEIPVRDADRDLGRLGDGTGREVEAQPRLTALQPAAPRTDH